MHPPAKIGGGWEGVKSANHVFHTAVGCFSCFQLAKKGQKFCVTVNDTSETEHCFLFISAYKVKLVNMSFCCFIYRFIYWHPVKSIKHFWLID